MLEEQVLVMRVIKTGQKAEPQQGMSDTEVIMSFHELEEQLGLREKNSLLVDLEIPELNPIPMEKPDEA